MERAQLLRAARLGIGLVVLTAFACTAATPATSGGSPTASGTAAPTGAKVASLEITAQDYSFTVPESVPSGWTKITFKNAGTEIHHVQVFRGKTGVTAAQLTDAIKAGPEAIFKIATAEGGAGTIVPTSSTETYVRMLPGTYLLACFVAGADKVPHLAKGMVKVVTVTDQAAGAIITPPESESTVTLKDFTFSGIPDTLPAGRHVFRVANSGPQPHEANILQLAPGKTAKDVLAFFADPSGPPPFAAMGGVQGVTKGVDDAILVVDLKPGNYLAICNIPDPASGKPHSALGMIKEFTVK